MGIKIVMILGLQQNEIFHSLCILCNNRQVIDDSYLFAISTLTVVKTIIVCGVTFQLKSPMQIVMQVDKGQKYELESMIHDLEEENK